MKYDFVTAFDKTNETLENYPAFREFLLQLYRGYNDTTSWGYQNFHSLGQYYEKPIINKLELILTKVNRYIIADLREHYHLYEKWWKNFQAGNDKLDEIYTIPDRHFAMLYLHSPELLKETNSLIKTTLRLKF